MDRLAMLQGIRRFRCIPVQSANNSRQNTQLLSSIITHHSDLRTNLRKIWSQRQCRYRHIFDSFRIESQDTKVVYRIAVDRIGINFFMVVEYAVSPERSGSYDMSIRHDIPSQVSIKSSKRLQQDLPSFCINHKPRCFTG